MNSQIETPDIESSTPDYRRRFAGNIGAWFLQVQDEATRKALHCADGKTALDVGGGHAQNVEVLRANGFQLHILGSDESCSQLIRNEILTQKLSFSTGNIVELPFDDNSYDVVLSYRMLAHIDNWQAHIASLCRTSNDMVIVDFPTKRSLNFIAEHLFSFKKKLEKNTREFALFDEADIVAEFSRHGFEPVARTGQYFLPMAMYRGLKCVGLAKMLEGFSTLLGLNQLFGSPVICGFKKKG
jgi:2-polyprenyl-3-methyl-5-hydroxy-6-metoxy-1,4-benzoquinol methylase